MPAGLARSGSWSGNQTGAKLGSAPIGFPSSSAIAASQSCGGVEVHVTHASVFRPVAVYVALVALARAQEPGRFQFRTERYEYVDTISAFDLLTGGSEARLAIEAGEDPEAVARAASASDEAWPEAIAHAERLVAAGASGAGADS